MPIRARAAGVARETIRRIDSVVLDDFKPDLTLILDLDVETGLAAGRRRAAARKPASRISTAISMKSCARPFCDIAKRNPDRCVVIDASRQRRRRSPSCDLGRGRQPFRSIRPAWPNARAANPMTATGSRALPHPRETFALVGQDAALARAAARHPQRPAAAGAG